ncbi:MAG: 1-deoxy-D-xylulose-5-phosphate reductoisomerase [Nitrospirota bacterium]
MKNIVILGSTGSIGTNTLEVIERSQWRFQVIGLTASRNIEKLREQIKRFSPDVVAVGNKETADRLKDICKDLNVDIHYGVEGIIKVSTLPESDLVVSAIVGAAGLIPTISAIKAKKDIALANKETMVMAGEIVVKEARKNRVRILPVDSEHNAIFQALHGHKKKEVKRLILTASGGPLIDTSFDKRKRIRPKEVLWHPVWRMGAKISIDSATLMNKGLELIEARWLFDIPVEHIDILIHRQSIIHSMVEYIDGSIIAQMSMPDMKLPIAYALNYPERIDLDLPSLDLTRIEKLTFKEPDLKKFPSISYAYEAIKVGGTMPTVLNASNEEAVKMFLQERIEFLNIPKIIRKTMDAHTPKKIRSLEDVLLADGWARRETVRYLK